MWIRGNVHLSVDGYESGKAMRKSSRCRTTKRLRWISTMLLVHFVDARSYGTRRRLTASGSAAGLVSGEATSSLALTSQIDRLLGDRTDPSSGTKAPLYKDTTRHDTVSSTNDCNFLLWISICTYEYLFRLWLTILTRCGAQIKPISKANYIGTVENHGGQDHFRF